MDKDYLKELLNSLRASKTRIWSAIIVISGGIVGLMFKIAESKLINVLILAWLLLFAGIYILTMLINSNYKLQIEEDKAILKLKKLEGEK